jgi:glycosyltransferase involved in cell wall biosynthesis
VPPRDSMADRVSVLIPCYNGARYLPAAIESALAQTLRPVAVMVVDDGSTDGSADIARRYARHGVEVVAQTNRGVSAARNAALRKTDGEWCVFLDADDELAPDFLRTQQAAGKAAEADIVFGSFVMSWPDGRRLKRRAMPADATIDEALSRVLGAWWYPPNAILWRTRFLRDLGGWDETLSRNEDGELVARALLRRPRLTSNFEGYAIYRQHFSGMRVSGRKNERAIQSNFRIGESIAATLSSASDLTGAKQQLAASMFELAEEAHVLGYHPLGQQIEHLARRLGPYRGRGTLMHRLGTRVLGIEGKAKLAARVRSLRSRMGS